MSDEAIFKTLTTTTSDTKTTNLYPSSSSLLLFGAVYATNSPHIVVTTPSTTVKKRSTHNYFEGEDEDEDEDETDVDTDSTTTTTTYMVPLLEPNMMGSLCIVTNSSDRNDRLTTNSNNELCTRRRLQLNATAILRFRIVQMIHTGYDAIYHQHPQHSCNDPKPYMVALVQLLLPSSKTTTTTTTTIHDNPNAMVLSPPSPSPEPDQQSVVVLPQYLNDIVTQYGSTILSSCTTLTLPEQNATTAIAATTTGTGLQQLQVQHENWDTQWRYELNQFYNITSLASATSSLSSNKQRGSTVPNHQEQTERLRLLYSSLDKVTTQCSNINEKQKYRY
jgi:hypothetical protein